MSDTTDEWLCPECGEREQLMRAVVSGIDPIDRSIIETTVKFQCGRCGYTQYQHQDDNA
jgi:ribosomal protein S27AE